MNLVNNFLIAMPMMEDPRFSHTLTYICEHNTEGALGIIVNRPIDMDISGLFERVDLPLQTAQAGQKLYEMPVYYGGPVQTDRGFVLHRPHGSWHSTLDVTEEIGLTSSRDILQAMSSQGEPRDAVIALGYAGWTAGQLEEELAANVWLSVPAEPNILFATAAHARLDAALRLLGVEISQLSDVAGHA